MTNDQRKLEQTKLRRLWVSKKISDEIYAQETIKLLERWAQANYGKKRAS